MLFALLFAAIGFFLATWAVGKFASQMNSPLGKYAAPAAAILSIGIVAVYMLAVVFQHALSLADTSLSQLRDLAILAAGAVFGSAVAVNGYKAPLNAMHKRLDAMGAPAAKDGVE